jgi:crotonobetainyl-CoA:carnitine CoA-transferase CaiB-like acyl-CoA transferase
MPDTLSGIIVVDLTQNIAGPYCTQLLGDFGASVLKIERPGAGDDSRRWAPPYWGDESAAFLAFNRNKKSLCVDLDDPRGREIARKLMGKADVFVHSMKPQSAEARGFGYEQLSAANRALIYCAISGFGDRGPARDLPGYDPVLQAFTGNMSLTGYPDQPPARIGAPVIDMGTGMWAFIGVLIALMERDKTGKGSRVTASLLETGVAWTTLLMAGYLASGKVPGRMGSNSPLVAPYEAFESADGWMMIAAGNDRLFGALCNALGTPELRHDPRFLTNADRIANRAVLHDKVQQKVRLRTAAQWVEILREAGVPCSPINSLDQVYADEQVKALGIIKDVSEFRVPGFKIIDVPMSVNGQRSVLHCKPPRLGEHTTEVLRWAGYTGQEIDELKRDKVAG